MATWEHIALRAEKAYAELKAEFEQYKKESVKWSVRDFTTYDGYKISKANAQIALEEMIENHDANYGITWCDVQSGLDDHGRKLKEKL